MAAKTTEAERRSKVAEACLDFGSKILENRRSSVTPDDVQRTVKELFAWFESHDGFEEANFGIAVHTIEFGKNLLESRKTATIQDALDAIRKLYSDLRS
jgi:hypothetical protein